MLAWLGSAHGPATILGIGATRDALVTSVLSRQKDALQGLAAAFVEDDPLVAARASAALRRLGLPGFSVVCGDAGQSDTYAGRVPADLILLGPDVVDGSQLRRRGLGEALSMLLTARGQLAWWSARDTPIAGWPQTLARAGLVALAGGRDWGFHRLVDRPRQLCDGVRLFPNSLPG